MRYLINERDTDEATSLALYRTTLDWAAARADRFVLRLERDVYDDPADVARLRALGRGREVPAREAPDDLVSRIIASLFGDSAEGIQVAGTPDEQFVRELTSKAAPPGAVAGDTSQVEVVMLFAGERALYASYDYGRTQVLDLTEEELGSLKQALAQAGLDPATLIPAPPYVTDPPRFG